MARDNSRRNRAAAWPRAWLVALLIVFDGACDNGGARAPGVDPEALPPARCSPVVTSVTAPRDVYLVSAASGFAVSALAGGQPATETRPEALAQQRFTLTPIAGGGVTLVSSTGACLSRAGAGAALTACTEPGARWTLASQRLIADDGLALGVVDAVGLVGRALVRSAPAASTTAFLLIDAGFRAPGITVCDDPPLDQLTFLATHNSFHSSGEGAKLLPNQSRSVAQQLADGVRGLLLDVYDWDGTVWTCHGSCLVPGLRGRPLREHLASIAELLARDREAIVTIFFEDGVASPASLCGVIAAVPGLAARVFDPAQYGVHERGWPRRSYLLGHDQRLIMFSQRAGREACGIQHDRRYTAENFWSLGPPGVGNPDVSCLSRWAGQPLAACTGARFRPLFLMNHFRDTLYSPFCAGDNGALLRQRALEICPQAAAQKPNYIAVDCYETGDAAALVASLNRCDPEGCRCPP